MSLVPAQRTPCSPADLIAALKVAYAQQLGQAPSDATLAILCAQVALETGQMRALICWNLGNYRKGVTPDWCEFETVEWQGSPPKPVKQMGTFSAWPDLTSAAEFFVRGLYTHWVEAWHGAVQGDADAFTAGLKFRGYFTAPLAQYAAGVKRWHAYYLDLLGGDSAVTEPELPVSEGGAAALATTGLLDEPPDSAA